jgi:hypothetical protein
VRRQLNPDATGGLEGDADGVRPPGDLRCECGALVARRKPEGIELKCRRCRRSLLLRLEADGGVTICVSAPGGEE